MAAALAISDAGVEAVIFERDSIPAGSTALSSGMIPACVTRQQSLHDIDDSVSIMAADIQKKAKNLADPTLVQTACQASGPLVDWLSETHSIELILVEGFLYPGHSRLRMHAPPSRSGVDLINELSRAAEDAGITIMTDARVDLLYVDERAAVKGLRIERPDGRTELIGCGSLILACNGFGGNPHMVTRYIEAMASANYFGHAGNQGDAIQWGQEMGAATRDLGSYQGHGSVAHPHGILISWALMMEGGIQINLQGERFSNEHAGYSEQARLVIEQPQSIAWNIFDARLHALGNDFEDYRRAEKLGALKIASDVEQLAQITNTPLAQLQETLQQVALMAKNQLEDKYGRDFTGKPVLTPPYYTVQITGSLFHTQGGLVVDDQARVQRQGGGGFPNLFAGGGAACGVSGPEDWGYLSGNGLLTALTLGRIAGMNTAAMNKP
jgi:fumarate reductase flavoprotein subunit